MRRIDVICELPFHMRLARVRNRRIAGIPNAARAVRHDKEVQTVFRRQFGNLRDKSARQSGLLVYANVFLLN